MATEITTEPAEMSVLDPQGEDVDPRKLLMQRILASPDFLRSPQLARFLTYICNAFFEGSSETLSEQHIGVAVFGRELDYDSSADTIVRSHALRLRRRLEQFFQRAGRREPIHLIIPRGGYVPVFLPSEGSRENGLGDEPRIDVHAVDGIGPLGDFGGVDNSRRLQVQQVELLAASTSEATLEASDWQDSAQENALQMQAVVSRYRIFTAVLAMLCIGLLVASGFHLRTHFLTKRRHILWSHLFTDDQPTHIVLGDSGLVLFHAVTKQRVSLHDYLANDVSKQLPFVQRTDPGFAQFLLHRRYTSTVDATALTHLLRLPEAIPERTLVHYGRDMHLNDFKTGNLILVGAQEAVPWVELFENHMDFVFSIDNPDAHSSFNNRHPAAGELSNYSPDTPMTQSKAYAVLAFLPNLSGTGNVLILEGLTMVGTEAAVDLAMDDNRLYPILAKLRRPNGELPHFEMLLESDLLGDSAGPARVVAVHLHD